MSYTVPARPRVNVGLSYLRDIRHLGGGLAESALLERMLGRDGYEALCGFEGLKREQLRQVTETAARLALGALEDDDGDEDEPESAGGNGDDPPGNAGG